MTLSLAGRISVVFSWYLYFSLDNKPSVTQGKSCLFNNEASRIDVSLGGNIQ